MHSSIISTQLCGFLFILILFISALSLVRVVVAIDQTEALSSLNEFAENDRILLGTVVDQASDASLIALTVVPYLFLSYFNQILALYGALR